MVELPKRERFRRAAPAEAYFLDAEDSAGLHCYLRHKGLLDRSEVIACTELAGQGNMNYTVRVMTNSRSFVLKQSRPWVEKYPNIAAPFNRVLMEAQFYRELSDTPASSLVPKFYWVDEISRIICLEDLGKRGDLSTMYRGKRLEESEQDRLCRFLSSLHGYRSSMANREMRALNHTHIFVYPFDRGNGLDLDRFTSGLQAVSESVKSQTKLLDRIAFLGHIYLADGDWLLHGDYFPGSWMSTEGGVKVIDPEFAFAGPREFDIGVMLAHLMIAGDDTFARSVRSHYSRWDDLDHKLANGFAGVEVLRRLLGVAQLPLDLGLSEKRDLVEMSIARILE